MTELYLKAILKGLLLLMAYAITESSIHCKKNCENKMMEFSEECNDLFKINN